ncbi:MAG TPA: hypothetical protein VLI67_05795 [Vicinamibacteria bacterium]|nr:hypothetical protein [Vicinamibacteria bacterium]
MRPVNQRGEGRGGALVSLALFVAVGYAGWNVIPVYWAHYDFVDKVNEICRTPIYKARTDEVILEMLMREVRNRRLDDWIKRGSFKISTTETSRRIVLAYEREVLVLPGWKRVLKFDFTSDQPLV